MHIFLQYLYALVSFAAVSWGGALRDDPNNGCEGDYTCIKSVKILIQSQSYTELHLIIMQARMDPNRF